MFDLFERYNYISQAQEAGLELPDDLVPRVASLADDHLLPEGLNMVDLECLEKSIESVWIVCDRHGLVGGTFIDVNFSLFAPVKDVEVCFGAVHTVSVYNAWYPCDGFWDETVNPEKAAYTDIVDRVA